MSSSSEHSSPPHVSGRVDYQETPDVAEIHAAVQREKPEPSADVTPMPLWLTGVCALATIWAGVYFGIFNGGLSGDVYNEYESSPAVLFPLPEAQTGKAAAGAAPEQTLAQQGKAVFAQCVACHQPSGQGVPGQYPSLVGSDWVQGSEKRLVAILLKGLQGPITVAGKPFTTSNQMPAWESALSPKKIAAVASYIRQEWGNKGGEISEAKVAAAKKEFAAQSGPWTEAQLLRIPAEATLPDQGSAGPAAPAGGASAVPSGGPFAPHALVADTSQRAKEAASLEERLAEGKKSYMAVCVACHQPTGLGLPLIFPSLVKSPYANGSPERFAAIIVKGISGAMTVDGKNYEGVMPGQESVLSDEKIASIMTFVRASFGNSSSPVESGVVSTTRAKLAERKTPWTQLELDAWQNEATISR